MNKLSNEIWICDIQYGLKAFGGGAPSAPSVPVPPPQAAPPILASTITGTSGAAASARSKAAAAAGSTQDSTVGASGPQGLVQAPVTENAKLLGQ